MIKKISTFLFIILFVVPAFGGAWQNCAQRIINDGVFAQKVREIVGNDRAKAGEVLQAKADDIRLLLLAKMFDTETGFCKNEIVDIAKQKTLELAFDVDGRTYQFDIDVDRLFDNFATQTAIMVYNDRSKRMSNPIKNSDIKKSYWSDSCSDLTIWDNLDDKASVNIAGQQIFSEYGGTKNEFFLDFEKGNTQRAFPGLVLEDVTNSTEENIVIFTHLPTALKKVESFAKNLENSSCGNQGLAVYLVSIAGNPDKGNSGYGTAGTVTAGTGLGIGTIMVGGTAIAAKGFLGATIGAALISGGASVSWVPVAGWIIGGAALVVGGVITLIPANIANIDQVYVLDGPYIIR